MTPPTNTLSVKRCFFISGMGRSGTQWLSALMRESPNVFIQHEWHKLRYGALEPMHNEAVGLPFSARVPSWETIRVRAVRAAMCKCGKEVYGECGNKTRYALARLEREFQPVFLMQLVRDGRDVVRSMWSRQTYSGHDLHPPLMPGPGDSYAVRWDAMDRFEKLCWLWAFTVEMVDFHAHGNFVRFEDLLLDYNTLCAKILEPVGMTIPKQVWEAYIGRRIDKSHAPLRFPHWSDWMGKRAKQYWDICGKMMQRFGYD